MNLKLFNRQSTLECKIYCSLDWKEQIKAVSTKVSRAIGFLKLAKFFLPMASLKTLNTRIVELHFRYCCSVWGCAGSTEINQLQKLQNRAARIITNSSDTPSRPHIVQLGWLTFEELIENESKTMVFKSLIDLAPQCLCSLFTRNSACSFRNLRNTEIDLRLLKKNSANGPKCFFSFRGAKLWNSLLAESKTLSSLNGFKKPMKD